MGREGEQATERSGGEWTRNAASTIFMTRASLGEKPRWKIWTTGVDYAAASPLCQSLKSGFEFALTSGERERDIVTLAQHCAM